MNGAFALPSAAARSRSSQVRRWTRPDVRTTSGRRSAFKQHIGATDRAAHRLLQQDADVHAEHDDAVSAIASPVWICDPHRGRFHVVPSRAAGVRGPLGSTRGGAGHGCLGKDAPSARRSSCSGLLRAGGPRMRPAVSRGHVDQLAEGQRLRGHAQRSRDQRHGPRRPRREVTSRVPPPQPHAAQGHWPHDGQRPRPRARGRSRSRSSAGTLARATTTCRGLHAVWRRGHRQARLRDQRRRHLKVKGGYPRPAAGWSINAPAAAVLAARAAGPSPRSDCTPGARTLVQARRLASNPEAGNGGYKSAPQ